MKYKYWNLPKEVRTILAISDGWLVGSAASCGINDENTSPKDFDVICTDYNRYQQAVLHLEKCKVEINSCGGLKFHVVSVGNPNGYKIDLWPQDLDAFIKNTTKLDYAYHFNTQTVISRL